MDRSRQGGDVTGDVSENVEETKGPTGAEPPSAVSPPKPRNRAATARKVLRILAWTVTVAVFIAVVLPSVLKLVMMSDTLNNEWIGFQLTDEAGQMHTGLVDLGSYSGSFNDVEIVSYGYQPPAGTDLRAWHVPPSQAKEVDGFVWSDKGFLWSDYQPKGDWNVAKGTRLGLDTPVAGNQQMELTLPGAPWDMVGPDLSFLGRFPDYAVKFENENFAFDLNLTATTPAWSMYNAGQPLRTGDFGLLSMNELPTTVAGVITHKKTGETFNVSGPALMESNIGLPWNATLAYGTHDWAELHFPGGWSGSLWKAQDDWQWGYHRDPHLGWLWDPELKKFLTFNRVDIVEADYVVDEVSGARYPRRAVWRAIGPDATLEVENTNVSFLPRETRLGPLVKLSMAYGPNASTGRLVRRDGTVVELGTGVGFMEYFPSAIPDVGPWAPSMLILLVVIWGVYVAVKRWAGGRSIRRSILPSVGWCALGLFAVWALNLAWSIG